MFFNNGDVLEPKEFRRFPYGITSVLSSDGDINLAIKLKTHKGHSHEHKALTESYLLSMVQYLFEYGDFLSAMEIFNVAYSSITYRNTANEEDVNALTKDFGELDRIVCNGTRDKSSNVLKVLAYPTDKAFTFTPFVVELSFGEDDRHELTAKVPTGKLDGNVCYISYTSTITGNEEDTYLHCIQFLRLLTLILGDSKLLIGREF